MIYLTAIHYRSENPRNRRQARRESLTVAGAGGKWSRDRRRAEEGPRTFSVRGSDLGGDQGRRAIPCASDLRSHPQKKLGLLLRLDSRLRGCDRATGQKRVDHRTSASLAANGGAATVYELVRSGPSFSVLFRKFLAENPTRIDAMLCYESSPCVSECGRGAPLGI